MNCNSLQQLKPFISILIVVTSLFSIVFLKMENRRLGYSVLKLSRVEKHVKDEKRLLSMEFAKLVRPDRIEIYAKTFLDLKKATKGQIIQISGQKLAFVQ